MPNPHVDHVSKDAQVRASAGHATPDNDTMRLQAHFIENYTSFRESTAIGWGAAGTLYSPVQSRTAKRPSIPCQFRPLFSLLSSLFSLLSSLFYQSFSCSLALLLSFSPFSFSLSCALSSLLSSLSLLFLSHSLSSCPHTVYTYTCASPRPFRFLCAMLCTDTHALNRKTSFDELCKPLLAKFLGYVLTASVHVLVTCPSINHI